MREGTRGRERQGREDGKGKGRIGDGRKISFCVLPFAQQQPAKTSYFKLNTVSIYS